MALEEQAFEGVCRGGPLAGEVWQSRFPKGFLLVDKPNNKCWIYEWDDSVREFKIRDSLGEVCHTEGEKNRYRAAEEPNYDVLAAPWSGSDGN